MSIFGSVLLRKVFSLSENASSRAASEVSLERSTFSSFLTLCCSWIVTVRMSPTLRARWSASAPMLAPVRT
jgi:hypothetical protein